MGVKRSKYEFQYLGDKTMLNNLLLDYLRNDNFSLTKKDGEEFYKTPSTIDGTKAFRYAILNDKVVIEAWLVSGAGDMAVDSIYSVFSKKYKESLDILFKQIMDLNNSAIESGYVKTRERALESEKALKEANIKKQKQLAKEKRMSRNSDLSLFMAFIALLLSITGYTFVTFFMIMAIYYAVMGWNSKRRYESIIAIVLTAISIILFVSKLGQ